MSAEDLERYEADMELQLYQEYKDVLGMFQYAIETERRFYGSSPASVGLVEVAVCACVPGLIASAGSRRGRVSGGRTGSQRAVPVRERAEGQALLRGAARAVRG
jgi:hypothetical protein